MNIKGILSVISLPVFFASLAPVILVLVGLSTVSFATSLTNILDGTYRWVFDIVGVITLVISIIVYFRKHGEYVHLIKPNERETRL